MASTRKSKKTHDVFVLRHMKALSLPPKATYRNDIGRSLSPEGFEQAEKRKSDFSELQFVAVGASPATRAVQTAATIAGMDPSDVDKIYDILAPDPKKGAQAKQINFLYDNIGDSPLSGYMIRREDAIVMEDYGRETWRAMRRYLGRKGAGDVLIVGHAILLPATFFAAIEGHTAAHREMRQALRDAVLHPGDGFRVRLEYGWFGPRVTAVELLPPPGQGAGDIIAERAEAARLEAAERAAAEAEAAERAARAAREEEERQQKEAAKAAPQAPIPPAGDPSEQSALPNGADHANDSPAPTPERRDEHEERPH